MALAHRPVACRRGGGRRQEYFDLVDPMSDRELKNSVMWILGPSRFGGAVSSDCTLDRVSESVLGLLDKGQELEIMLFSCRERVLILKEEPPSP